MKRAWILCLVLLTACSGFIDSVMPPPPPPGSPALHLVGNFSSPVYLTAAPGDTRRLFVVEQYGRVVVLHNDTIQTRPFLDLRGRIAAGGEQGLLSLAFDPQYATSGRFFVYFTDANGDIRIVRYHVSTDPDSADETTADTVLWVPHPGQTNHNGGQLQFGPDGMLWAGTGDGGGGGDPNGNGQNKHALLGKLLRLDVSGVSGYAIPADNPFKTDTSGAPEVWSYGLRNPWRFSFDRQNGDLYIGDVGQNRFEEVDVSPATVLQGRGANFGWNIMEGLHCYPNDPCTTTGILPVVEYAHGFGACSITGGYVYRGSALPVLAGLYLYADYCDGSVHAIEYPSNTTPTDLTGLLSPGGGISSFGQDLNGELYVLQLGGGVYRIVSTP